jgi:hypothetical protein
VSIENGRIRGGVNSAPFFIEGGFCCQALTPGTYLIWAGGSFSGIEDQLGRSWLRSFSKALEGHDEVVRCH